MTTFCLPHQHLNICVTDQHHKNQATVENRQQNKWWRITGNMTKKQNDMNIQITLNYPRFVKTSSCQNNILKNTSWLVWDLKPQDLDLKPQDLDLIPEDPDLKPEALDLNPKDLDL